MHRLAGAVSAVAFVGVAASVWAGLVTTAAGRMAAYDVGALFGARPTQGAHRLPTDGETLRAADFVRQPTSVERSVVARGKTDPRGGSGDCALQHWPFMGTECFAATLAEPVRTANATMVIEPPSVDTPEPVRAPAAATTAPAAATIAPQPATIAPPVATTAPPACRQNLAAATARMERALAAVKGTRASDADLCATFQRNLFEVAQARAVTALCKIGPDRDSDLGRIDVALEDINAAIARTCGT